MLSTAFAYFKPSPSGLEAQALERCGVHVVHDQTVLILYFLAQLLTEM